MSEMGGVVFKIKNKNKKQKIKKQKIKKQKIKKQNKHNFLMINNKDIYH